MSQLGAGFHELLPVAESIDGNRSFPELDFACHLRRNGFGISRRPQRRPVVWRRDLCQLVAFKHDSNMQSLQWFEHWQWVID